MLLLAVSRALTPASPVPVIVESTPADPVAVAGLWVAIVAAAVALVTLAAVGIQIYIAKRTLDATIREISLAENQLRETQAAAERTTEALSLTRDQIGLMRADSIAAIRQAAPQLIAEVRDEEFGGIPERNLFIINKGNGVARYVAASGMTPSHEGTKIQFAAEHVFQVIGPGEERPAMNLSYPTGSYARNIRIRYRDVHGNKYITEYEAINEGLSYPVLREPWLGREFGFPKPEKWSEEVSWPVDHYERHPDMRDEPVTKPPPEDEPAEMPSIFETLGFPPDRQSG